MTNTAHSATAPAIFNFRATEVRTVIRDGDVWFVASDVCNVLGMKNHREAIRHLDADEKGVISNDTPGGTQTVSIINESGLYALVLRSRKPEARPFVKWVTSEVLPAIRKTGSYTIELTKAQAGEIAALMADRFPAGKDRPYAWSRFNNHFRLASYKDLPAARFAEACEYVRQMPVKQPVALPAPEVAALDVRKVLLSDLATPTIPLPPEIEHAITQRAFGMGIEAFDLCKEHLKRRVAYTSEMGMPRQLSTKRAMEVIDGSNLNDALVHTYLKRVESMHDYALHAQLVANEFVKDMEGLMNGTLAPGQKTGIGGRLQALGVS